jgi:hypothetical protein
MNSRPILFSGAMVRALLDGKKTQTRRVCKPANEAALTHVVECPYAQWGDEDGDVLFKSPYGVFGDQLWVRETFCPIYPQDPSYNGGQPIEYDYAATYKHGNRLGDSLGIKKVWRPSIHMPRAASRITLEITGVRVERLQDISEADAMAEGITHSTLNDPRVEYRWLWESINGPGSWDANPWVWCVSFRRISEGGREGVAP